MPIKKGRLDSASSSSVIKSAVPRPLLKFSFRFFDASDAEVCPPVFHDGYVQDLMDRLKALSAWTVQEFVASRSSATRIHPIEWRDTARPRGFALPEQLSAYLSYQFAISANKRGRVHGLLIDDTFYVVWLDQDHKVYP
jgi:hypothetical protein